MKLTVSHRDEDGARLASLLWECGPGWRMISSAVLGGGIGERTWVLNAQVIAGYSRMDPADHLAALGPAHGAGVGMMTAAKADHYARGEDGGVEVVATVGLRVPTWAASPEGAEDPELAPIRVGTINIIAAVPVAMTDAALVNTVMTATEAKTQALLEAGHPGTGTASDAICVAVRTEGPREPFGGPRSTWGARLARAVHQAVAEGAAAWHSLAAAE
ncbi:adenosylcobinamide amidohydrolase [Thermocatellispora tengchongensis]|uniref:Adenosylcobinamide amidohydrolase n=1 Tax=Thermocatellispora tengchongensis TaxID=1073253 RepID=A0A840PA00_9ACTN|nr:adenosylcobinamide amidohydrolase [Thermocatellispora tengchongensis]MBB5132825.1 adenosylcobinamide amidohydrolase [Thermocatellispora tengchongensis]